MSGLGKYAEATQFLIPGYEGVLKHKDAMPFENREIVNEVRDSISQLYRAWGKPAPVPLNGR